MLFPQKLAFHLRCINSSGWKRIPRPLLLAPKSQLAGSGRTTILGKKHDCLLCPSLLSPSPPSPWHIQSHHLLPPRVGLSRPRSSAGSFGLGTQASRRKSQTRSGEHHPRWEPVQANTQRAAALGADRPQTQILGQLHPVNSSLTRSASTRSERAGVLMLHRQIKAWAAPPGYRPSPPTRVQGLQVGCQPATRPAGSHPAAV